MYFLKTKYYYCLLCGFLIMISSCSNMTQELSSSSQTSCYYSSHSFVNLIISLGLTNHSITNNVNTPATILPSNSSNQTLLIEVKNTNNTFEISLMTNLVFSSQITFQLIPWYYNIKCFLFSTPGGESGSAVQELHITQSTNISILLHTYSGTLGYFYGELFWPTNILAELLIIEAQNTDTKAYYQSLEKIINAKEIINFYHLL